MLIIQIEREADRVLSRLPRNVVELVEAKIEQLAKDPESLKNNIKKLVGTHQSRLRVGDLRIIFRIQKNVLTIARIAPRGNVYI
jgi:mRNA interferase RelE/StbE